MYVAVVVVFCGVFFYLFFLRHNNHVCLQKADDCVYEHRVRVAIGNGLRPDIWEDFKRRFNVETIVELFAATEGNGMLFNVDNKVGACGRYSPLLKVRDM